MHHLAQGEMSKYGAELLHYRIVDQGDIITARGVTSGTDLALWITEKFASSKLQLLLNIEWNMRGEVLFGSNLIIFLLQSVSNIVKEKEPTHTSRFFHLYTILLIFHSNIFFKNHKIDNIFCSTLIIIFIIYL